MKLYSYKYENENHFGSVIVVKMAGKLFLLTILLIVLLNGLVESGPRIYGGYRIDITEQPCVVSIVILIEMFSNGTSLVHQCTGSILRRNLILTAAHCIITKIWNM